MNALTPSTPEPLPPPVADELLATLPAVLRAVVRALGLVRAQEFLGEHGGVNWNVPIHRHGSALSAAELARLAQGLAPHMDENRRVWLPKVDKILRRARDAQIRRERSYTSISQLAYRYRLTDRHILNVCRDNDDQKHDLDAQLGLF